MQYIKISFERLPNEDLSTLDSISTRMKISLVNGQQIDWESVSGQLIKTLQDHSIWLAIPKKNFQPGSYRINKGWIGPLLPFIFFYVFSAWYIST